MPLFRALSLTALLLHGHLAHAQFEDINAAFNSTISVSSTQAAEVGLSTEELNDLNVGLRYDQSQLANGGVSQDAFYQLPPLTNTTGPLEPGTLLKVQEFTNLSTFSLPPTTALSRIMYTTTNANGTVIPATAFVLWPFHPRKFQNHKACNNDTDGKAPVILWTHGTSGVAAEAAPSTNRVLWYGVDALFPLVLEGYAIVATDYAGLGISHTWDGSEIPHQYGHTHTMAHDALYSLEAAYKAFPQNLGKKYVVMGHSQGGGVAWAVAEALATEYKRFASLVNGYLGCIPGSPLVEIFGSASDPSGGATNLQVWVAMALQSIFPTFELSDWLTDLAIARVSLFKKLGGLPGPSFILFGNASQTIKPSFNQSWYADAFSRIGNAGRRPFKGPMLVPQGTNDRLVPLDIVNRTIQDTCAIYPEGDLEFLAITGAGHVPALDTSRQIWMKWIEDRFEGRPLKKAGCFETTLNSWLPEERYIFSGNSVTQWIGTLAKYSYAAVMNN